MLFSFWSHACKQKSNFTRKSLCSLLHITNLKYTTDLIARISHLSKVNHYITTCLVSASSGHWDWGDNPISPPSSAVFWIICFSLWCKHRDWGKKKKGVLTIAPWASSTQTIDVRVWFSTTARCIHSSWRHESPFGDKTQVFHYSFATDGVTGGRILGKWESYLSRCRCF